MTVLTAFCDLAFVPVSFDFTVWLVRAMLERDLRACDSLHVVLVPKEDGLGGLARPWGDHNENETMWRLWHIVIPIVQLAGATLTIAHSRFHAMQMNEGETWWPAGRAHLAWLLVEAARTGTPIPRIRASEQARRYAGEWLAREKRPVVTFTIRSQTTHADRNSNLLAWEDLQRWLESRGYAVLIIRDTSIALHNGDGWFPELDIDLRLAVYELASMNLFCNNGPAALALFSEAPFIQFGVGIPAQWIAHMEEHVGLKPGEQYPWSRPDQKVVWLHDQLATMRAAFEDWERRGPR